jgi:hypothetical protein
MTRHPPTTRKASPRKGKNKWTYEQRVTLDILWTHPGNLPLSERTRVFNAVFSDYLATCGVHDGLASTALDSQYREREYKHKSSWASVWEHVCATPKLDNVLREQLSRRIDQVLMGGGATQVSGGPATPPITPPQRSESTQSSSAASARAGKRPSVVPTRFRDDQLITPGPSTRKRPATTSEVHLVFDDDEEDEDFEPGPKRARNPNSPVVELPATPPESIASISSIASGSKSARSPKKSRVPGRGRVGATFAHHRNDGVLVWLKEKEYQETLQPLKVISESAAHPETGPPIVFRYSDEKSHGL